MIQPLRNLIYKQGLIYLKFGTFKALLVISLKKKRMLKLLTAFLIVGSCISATTLDLGQQNKYGTGTIANTACNKDTQIDFFPSSDSLVCTGGVCSSANLGSSYMKFFDINGNQLTLTLNDARVVINTDVVVKGLVVDPTQYYLFRYQTDGAGHTVYVLVPLLATDTNSTSGSIVYPANDTTGSFGTFNSVGDGKNVAMTAFGYLNKADYGSFYTVTNSAKTETVLLSSIIIKIASPLATFTPPTPFLSFTPSYSDSGNKLCYGSNQVSGLFQSHLRESWPLWTCIISLLFYWLYYLLADAESNQCYDKRFEENRMTCWGFYSLHFLGHVEYFSRLTRLSLMYFVFSFQAVVLAALYQTLGDNKQPYTNYEMIIWTAAIAFAASLPIPYILGGIFLRPIYNLTLQKFLIVKKSRATLMKRTEQQAILQAEIDKLEQKTYSYYYWYYIIIFAGFVCFWVPAIYMMMQTHRNYYYLHRIWLASLAIAFVLDNLIFDPILSRLLGGTRLYRIRGYFYNFALGAAFKQIEE